MRGAIISIWQTKTDIDQHAGQDQCGCEVCDELSVDQTNTNHQVGPADTTVSQSVVLSQFNIAGLPVNSCESRHSSCVTSIETDPGGGGDVV